MNYSIFILPRSQKELAQLPVNSFERVRDAILALAQDRQVISIYRAVMDSAFELVTTESFTR